MRLPRLKRVVRHKRNYWYFRKADGSLLPLARGVEPGDPALLRAYAKAKQEFEAGGSKTSGRTVAAMAELYEKGPLFAALKPSTQEVRRRVMRRIIAAKPPGAERAVGEVSINAIKRRHIQADIDGTSPGSASHRLDTWRQMFRAARRADWLEDDPTREVELPRYKKKSREAWTADDVAAFEAHWPIGTLQRTAFALLYWTGARASDVAKLGWQHVKDGWLVWHQEKTGGLVETPIAAPLARVLTSVPQDRLTFIAVRGGQPKSQKSFSQWFAKSAREAGVNKSAHGLRHTLASAGADAGLTDEQIAAVTGHANTQEVKTYTKAANRRAMAERVVATLEEARATKLEQKMENTFSKSGKQNDK